MPSVSSLLVDKPSKATPVGDVLNFANPNEDEEAARKRRLAGRAMGWNTDTNPSGPLAPLSNMSVYRNLRNMQGGS